LQPELIGMLPLKGEDENLWLECSSNKSKKFPTPQKLSQAKKNFLALKQRAVSFLESVMDDRIFDIQHFLNSVPFIQPTYHVNPH